MIDNQKLKKRVEELCANERFVHHKWYFKHHLEIVERIVKELVALYPDANGEVLESLVWFHDLEKILKNQDLTPEGVLIDLSFEKREIDELIRLNEIEGKHREIDISETEIEVKILSSADAAAHFVGPFYSVYWYENPEKPMEDLTRGDLEKIKRDWERKMVLPEVKKSFLERKDLMLEQRGVYPDKFIK